MAFISLGTFDYGINWSLKYDSSGKASLYFSYYTIRIMYNMAGQLQNQVYPFDGRTINVPYQFFYD